MIEKIDKKILLSTLWLFALLNYAYADLFSLFFTPGVQEDAIAMTGGSEAAVLVFAALMETAIAMVLFSRILRYKLNRILNIVFGLFHSGFVAWSMFPESTIYYVFFAVIEIATTLLIVKIAWQWKEKEG